MRLSYVQGFPNIMGLSYMYRVPFSIMGLSYVLRLQDYPLAPPIVLRKTHNSTASLLWHCLMYPSLSTRDLPRAPPTLHKKGS